MAFTENLKQKVNDYLDRRYIHRLEDKVSLIAKEREQLQSWSDKDLRLASKAFKDDLKKGKELDRLLEPAFAVVCEAARRVLKQTPFDMQILAGIIIHQGRVAEMKAGEGKTLTETMPVYLNALTGRGVHIITTNDYLAERDAKLNGKLFEFLGMNSAYVASTMKNDQRRKAYSADITYVTNQEVGFDYLRDNLVYTRNERVLRSQHPLHFGIVDEIDSILIDESRTPLIIAEPLEGERNSYSEFTKIISLLTEDVDFTVDYKNKSAALTETGLDRVEKILGGSVFSKNNPMFAFYLDVCLRARVLFEKDRDYIITEAGVEIVDEFTGRVLPGRRFTDGVHQAIEAKEKVKVKEADRTVASITFQNFFPMYEKLSGMSGTVMQSRDEFLRVYKLDVIQIPTNRLLVRVDHNDLFFKTIKGKFQGLIKKINHIHQKNQPILIGARNVEVAHEVATILGSYNLPYQLLTAKDHKAEAEKISKAGQSGMITVATNMAGRGTDILLGEGVAKIGGLYVIGTERHESRRIDDQLRGRSGRQGDQGESQFLISMEDEIMMLFGSEKIIDTMEEYDIPEDEYISGTSLDTAFKEAQDFVESKNFDSRLYLYKYDSVINYQRFELYKLRDSLLENSEGFSNFVEQAITETVSRILGTIDPVVIAKQLKEIFGLEINKNDLQELNASMGFRETFNELLNPFFASIRPQMRNEANKQIDDELKKQWQGIKKNPEVHEAAQNLILEIIDSNWSRHLEIMDVLKEEAGLFSYASQDPLVDYILESKKMFEQMGEEIQRQFLQTVFGRINKS
ncbi:MAG: preprotein translocase subunit SecA [Patescibacteria group bacterium]